MSSIVWFCLFSIITWCVISTNRRKLIVNRSHFLHFSGIRKAPLCTSAYFTSPDKMLGMQGGAEEGTRFHSRRERFLTKISQKTSGLPQDHCIPSAQLFLKVARLGRFFLFRNILAIHSQGPKIGASDFFRQVREYTWMVRCLVVRANYDS